MSCNGMGVFVLTLQASIDEGRREYSSTQVGTACMRDIRDGLLQAGAAFGFMRVMEEGNAEWRIVRLMLSRPPRRAPNADPLTVQFDYCALHCVGYNLISLSTDVLLYWYE